MAATSCSPGPMTAGDRSPKPSTFQTRKAATARGASTGTSGTTAAWIWSRAPTARSTQPGPSTTGPLAQPLQRRGQELHARAAHCRRGPPSGQGAVAGTGTRSHGVPCMDDRRRRGRRYPFLQVHRWRRQLQPARPGGAQQELFGCAQAGRRARRRAAPGVCGKLGRPVCALSRSLHAIRGWREQLRGAARDFQTDAGLVCQRGIPGFECRCAGPGLCLVGTLRRRTARPARPGSRGFNRRRAQLRESQRGAGQHGPRPAVSTAAARAC